MNPEKTPTEAERKWPRRGILAVAATLAAGAVARAQPAELPDRGGAGALPADLTLRDLLDAGNVSYAIRERNGFTEFRIVKSTQEGTTAIIARELRMRWTRRDGSPVRMMHLYTTVVGFPENFTPPVALLKVIADRNNDLVFGNVGLGKHGVFFSTSMWLRNADLEQLSDVLDLSHGITMSLHRDMQPMVPAAS